MKKDIVRKGEAGAQHAYARPYDEKTNRSEVKRQKKQ